MAPHDEFLELCAVSTSGELSEQETTKLETHLAGCAECRQALQEFEAAVDVGVPFLASKLSPVRPLDAFVEPFVHRGNRNQSRPCRSTELQHRGPMQPMRALRPTLSKEVLPSLKETAAGTRRSIGTSCGCRSRLRFC